MQHEHFILGFDGHLRGHWGLGVLIPTCVQGHPRNLRKSDDKFLGIPNCTCSSVTKQALDNCSLTSKHAVQLA